MIKGVVFDLDGVIIDSPRIYFLTMKDFIKKKGADVSDGEIHNLIAFSLKDEFHLLRDKYGIDSDFEEFIEETLLRSRDMMESELQLTEGVADLLIELKKENYRVGLASNNNGSTISYVLKKFGIEKSFDAIVTAEEVKNGKPSPDVYEVAVKKLGLRPEECIGIEDSVIGMQAVKNAGLKCVVVPNEFTRGKEFNSADLLLKSLKELNHAKIMSMDGIR